MATRPIRALLVGASLAATSATAVAQEDTRTGENNGAGMDTHLFRPALDSKGFFATNGSDILGAGDISFGLVLDYGRNIMRTSEKRVPANGLTPGEDCKQGQAFGTECQPTESGSGVDSLVDNSFQGTFGFNIGLANAAVVGLSLPVVLMTGEEAYQIGENAALYNSKKLDRQEFATAALHGKVRITRVDRGPGLALAVQAGVPLGDAPKDLGADPGVWYWPQLIGELRAGRTGRFKIGANVGYRGHTGENPRFQQDSQGNDQLAEGEFQNGNLGTASAGLSYRALDSLDVVGETYLTYLLANDADSKQKLSQEYVGGIKLFIERNSFLMLGGGSRTYSTGFEAADLRLFLGFVFEPSIGDRDGDGYKDDQDECPDEPEDFDGFKDAEGCPDPDNDNDGILDVDDRCPNVPEDRDGDEDEDGCPEGSEGDRDGDGILDSRDKCPDDPEDRDGFEDKDGCPEPDNDKDQILDVKDSCPNDPETYNGFEDEDGCPDKGKVVIEGSDILILEKILFETNSAEIKPESMPIIEAVATTLKHHPEFQLIEVGGHADERSSDQYNLKLTQDRTQSVVEALIVRGIERSRVIAQGYGEFCPIDPGHNAVAWEKNRRVEFKVVKTEDGTTGVERGCEVARSRGIIPKRVGDDDDDE